MYDTGNVIFLNGANGAGKTLVSKTLQKILPEPFLHMSFKNYLGMLPQPSNPQIIDNLANGFIHSAISMLKQDNNLILDHILINQAWLNKAFHLLEKYNVFFFNIHCPYKALEERARRRYGNTNGVNLFQYKKIYSPKYYDKEFDSSLYTALEIAESINHFYRFNEPIAFSVLNNNNSPLTLTGSKTG